jgi:plastocyanin
MRRQALAARAGLVAALVAGLAGWFAVAPATAAAQLGGHGPAAHTPVAGVDAAPAPGRVGGQTVAQLFAAYSPADLDAVTGDSITWTNASARAHTVTADDESFDSGRLSPGQRYSHVFAAEGDVPYHCTLHAGMAGTVRVHDVVLGAPPADAPAGRPFPLRGRTALAPGTELVIEADTGAGFARVGRATVDATGAFATTIVAATSGRYRAVAADRVSEPIALRVLDRHVMAQVRRRGRTLVVDVEVMPGAAGQTVVLQRRLRERFGWWPVARAELDRRSHARFTVPAGRRAPARVQLTLPDGATTLASTGPLRIPR